MEGNRGEQLTNSTIAKSYTEESIDKHVASNEDWPESI